MNITLHTFLVVCPLVFLAGLVDAIGGGGGLISLPAFLIAGLPPHAAIATNKISSPFGTALATYRFAKAKLINLKLAAPAVVAAICGSFIGAQISLRVPEHILSYVLMVILPVSAFLVLNKKLFNDEGSEEITLNRRTYLTGNDSCFYRWMLRRILWTGNRNIFNYRVHSICSSEHPDRKCTGKSHQLDYEPDRTCNLSLQWTRRFKSRTCICSLQYAWRIHRCRTCDEKRF